MISAGGCCSDQSDVQRREIAFIQSDTNARLLICGSEVCEYALPLLLRGHLEHIVVTNYDDMCDLSMILNCRHP